MLVNPTGFVATQTGVGQVRLDWVLVKGAASYLLLGPGLPRGGVKVSGAATYTVTNVPGGPQRWQLGSLDATGNAGPTSAFATVDFVVGKP